MTQPLAMSVVKPIHRKSECPTLTKKKGKTPFMTNTNGQRRKAYIAWENEDEASSNISDNEPSYEQFHEEAKMLLK